MAANIEEFINASDDVSNAILGYNSSGDVSLTLPNAPALDSFIVAHQICNGSGAYDDPLGFANLNLLSPSGCRQRTSYNQMIRTGVAWSSSNAEATGGAIEIKQAA